MMQEDTYNKLLQLKGKDESFDDLILRIISQKQSGLTPKRVVIAGTFDIIHPGHLSFIQDAAKYGDVYVIVARDSNVIKIKGAPPTVPEEQRRIVVEGLKGVKQAVLGNESGDFTEKVAELQPDIVALGPNQKFDEDKLKQKLAEKGLKPRIIRITQFLDNIPLHSSSSIKNKIKNGNS